jgi:hypothetical protein
MKSEYGFLSCFLHYAFQKKIINSVSQGCQQIGSNAWYLPDTNLKYYSLQILMSSDDSV